MTFQFYISKECGDFMDKEPNINAILSLFIWCIGMLPKLGEVTGCCLFVRYIMLKNTFLSAQELPMPQQDLIKFNSNLAIKGG